MRCRSAKKAGIHYLEYESVQLTTKNGRIWEIYGSPVSGIYVQLLILPNLVHALGDPEICAGCFPI